MADGEHLDAMRILEAMARPDLSDVSAETEAANPAVWPRSRATVLVVLFRDEPLRGARPLFPPRTPLPLNPIACAGCGHQPQPGICRPGGATLALCRHELVEGVP